MDIVELGHNRQYETDPIRLDKVEARHDQGIYATNQKIERQNQDLLVISCNLFWTVQVLDHPSLGVNFSLVGTKFLLRAKP